MMKIINTTPNMLKHQIQDAIAKAIEVYRKDYPNEKSCFSRNRVLTFEKMVNLLLSMQGGSLNKELYDAGIDVTASAFVQQRNKLSWTIFEDVFENFNAECNDVKKYKNYRVSIAISNENLLVTNGTDDDLEQYFAFGNVEMIIADNFDELCKDDIYQIMCLCVEAEYEHVLQGTTNTQITAWWDKAVDIIPINCGKGNAVNAVLQYYGFTKDEAIAFGDGKNDIEMLEAVGTGVAMGNAKDEVKSKANKICKSVEEDGVYCYCLENNLI